VITGPSFLGLSTPGPAVDRHTQAARGRDPLQPSSRNLDYLLEDEEEPKRGSGKLILVVVALALAGGFGYLHWKQGGFEWLSAGDKKPAAAAVPAPDSGQSADSGTVSGTAPAPSAQAGTGTAGGSQNAAPGAVPENAAAQNAAQGVPPQNAAAQPTTGDSSAAASSAPAPAGTEADTPSTPAEAPAPSKAAADKPAPLKPVVPKPVAAKPTAAKPLDAVAEGERYIYGRGQRQDCDLGLRLLKTAAERSDAKAMISLGALYSTGTCTPRDLPTAYRWFALALHLQPDNQALQDDLQSLWAKMTQPERQLAIKLSQ
jgi:hypothetical protein